ncbi:hypothetical protein Kpol_534p18 [Vanderwaltozyma polyspora DSM 70294]|uniref:Aldehyde dehydrogenase domain-containing protein n=1 Tax=Vanderwaltozyma polyspora (strain ATCC 22028 / DSM 70294 / BCRC 21397 / CBS 2163 / NBRC 10782 / NRRL Y-8283 / UCD 57-17) TaxID=436907 RepID=A7TJJ6_VANPO|nr:uncharacterized protein Kpol_534p18 [Vanderwaltozyma polyspora DSM 70294]EDO17539.1 hypothetical protein Kpol_534p18 [Vanderwaltozyma polyspora DSM 70294]
MSTVTKVSNIHGVSVEYNQPLGLFINNEFVKSSDQEKIKTFNPSNGEYIVSFYAASEKDTNLAIDVAERAYCSSWSNTTPNERSELLDKLYHLTKKNRELLGTIETLDTGKPFHSNSLNDIDQILEVIRYYSGSCDKLTTGETFITENNYHRYTVKQPYGVVGLIVPWNYPLAMAAWKLFGCLAAGNTVVIKPSEHTSLSLLYYGKLLVEAGLPPGVVNIIPGYGEITGRAIAMSDKLQKLSFTGSTRVGKLMMEMSGQSNMKDVTLECGGKSPAVVFRDANLDNAASWIATGICYNSGQNCTATSRVYADKNIYNELISKIVEEIKQNWKISSTFDPFDDDGTLGPIINNTQYDRVTDFIHVGSHIEKLNRIDIFKELGECKGNYINPVIFTDVPQTSVLIQNEIFGPVLTISKFTTYDEVVKLVNDSRYGLAAAAFTEDYRLAHQFTKEVEAGTVWINSSNDECIGMPFGGFKMSGIGRELGATGVESYLQTKSVHFNLR